MQNDPNKLPEHFHDSADDGENITRTPEEREADRRRAAELEREKERD